MVPWQNLESDRVGADARATRRGRLWAVRPTARARPKGAAIHQKGTLTSAFLFWPPSAAHRAHHEQELKAIADASRLFSTFHFFPCFLSVSSSASPLAFGK